MVPGTCALCLAEKLLVKSHIIPRWAYERTRARGNPQDSNPVLVEDGKAFQSSQQRRKHLLCARCDERIGEREDYVSRVSWQADRTLPLLSHVARKPEMADEPIELAELAGADTDALAYFAMSVVWRAHLTGDGDSLGVRYGEVFRAYLNGECDFPACVRVWLGLYKPPTGVLDMSGVNSFPAALRDGGFHKHAFIICGIAFWVLVGSVLPKDSAELCLHHGSTKRVQLTIPEASGLAQSVIRMGGGARPSKKLAAKTTAGTWRKA